MIDRVLPLGLYSTQSRLMPIRRGGSTGYALPIGLSSLRIDESRQWRRYNHTNKTNVLKQYGKADLLQQRLVRAISELRGIDLRDIKLASELPTAQWSPILSRCLPIFQREPSIRWQKERLSCAAIQIVVSPRLDRIQKAQRLPLSGKPRISVRRVPIKRATKRK